MRIEIGCEAEDAEEMRGMKKGRVRREGKREEEREG
jgi:hypothetical protein